MLNRPHFYRNPRIALPFVFGIAAIGAALIYLTAAAPPTASREAEAGTVSEGASVVALSGASGGSAVRFSSSAVTPPSGALSAQDLMRIAQYKMFFGHQSVGGNILQGVPEVYASFGVTSIPVISTSAMAGRSGGYLAEAFVGQNFQPLLKNSDFNSRVRGGIGGQVSVAFYKYCYVDINSGTDTTALFNQYRSLMSALVRDYPNVRFLYVTNPLTTNDAADNIARERFNQLVRQEYGNTGGLFDIARVESTAPNGSRVGGSSGGNAYYSLYSGYTSDGGHLNATGRQVVARELLTVIANATR